MSDGDDLRELRALAARLAQLRQADILIFSGEMTRTGDDGAAIGRPGRARRPNCLLMLRTLGGSADAAYWLARSLQRAYRRLTVYVDDFCKGVGMLAATAADELVISDFGELGPLVLASQHRVVPSRGASGLAVGLMGPTFSQIDPFQVAEVERAMTTAALYARRLGADNLKDGALDRLLTGYPSHDFVVDREEASELLRTVRAPTPEEGQFLTYLEPVVTARRLQGRVLLLEDALSLVAAEQTPGSRDGEAAACQAATAEHAESEAPTADRTSG